MKWHVILLSERFELHILLPVFPTPQCTLLSITRAIAGILTFAGTILDWKRMKLLLDTHVFI
ncbi:MAG: hypothetical protein ACMUIU_18060 [bacterium]